MSQSSIKRNVRRLGLLVPWLVSAAACERPSYTFADDVPISSGASSSSGTLSGAGVSSSSGGASADPCAFNRVVGDVPILAKQVVSNQAAGRPETYAELTDEEAEKLRAGGALLPKPDLASGTSGLPTNALLNSILSQLQAKVTDFRAPLVKELTMRFQFTRSTWPNPWALRLIDHPGSEHMNPVRIVFKPEAWFARIVDGSPVVVDTMNMPVPFDDALKTPERIAAIYYTSDALQSTTNQCESGKRELVLGNEAMVDTFTLGTKEILARLNSDIDTLSAFFPIARPCTSFAADLSQTFHAATVCTAWRFFDPGSELAAYQWSLSNPVESYKPTPQTLDILISALKADRFEVNPFTGTPVEPVAMGGAAGTAGTAGAGGTAGTGGAGAGGANATDAGAAGLGQGGI